MALESRLGEQITTAMSAEHRCQPSELKMVLPSRTACLHRNRHLGTESISSWQGRNKVMPTFRTWHADPTERVSFLGLVGSHGMRHVNDPGACWLALGQWAPPR